MTKSSVDLAKPGKLGSRIRRDPPPPPKKVLSAAELRERESRRMAIGIAAVALSLFLILLGINQWTGRDRSGEKAWVIRIDDRV